MGQAGGAREVVRRTDEVAVLKIEAVQLIAGLLGVHDIFEDDEGGTLGGVGDALADLTTWSSVTVRYALSAQLFASTLRRDYCSIADWEGLTYRTGPNFPKRSKSSSAETL